MTMKKYLLLSLLWLLAANVHGVEVVGVMGETGETGITGVAGVTGVQEISEKAVDDSSDNANAGSVWIFSRSGTRWSQQGSNDYEQHFPLHNAVCNNDISEVKRLIVSGADVNEKDDNGYPPLHLATRFFDIAQLLINAGADVDARSGSIVGYTALHNAASIGSEQLIFLLLNEGASVNAIDGNGMTPLDLVYWFLKEYSEYFHSEDEQRYNAIIAMLRDAGAMTGSYVKFNNLMRAAVQATSIIIPPVMAAAQLFFWHLLYSMKSALSANNELRRLLAHPYLVERYDPYRLEGLRLIIEQYVSTKIA